MAQATTLYTSTIFVITPAMAEVLFGRLDITMVDSRGWAWHPAEEVFRCPTIYWFKDKAGKPIQYKDAYWFCFNDPEPPAEEKTNDEISVYVGSSFQWAMYSPYWGSSFQGARYSPY